MLQMPPAKLPASGVRCLFETDEAGPQRLIQAVLPGSIFLLTLPTDTVFDVVVDDEIQFLVRKANCKQI